MNFKILILEEAKSDVRESIAWYKNINPMLSKRFVNSFNNSVKQIKENPFRFQIRYDEIRVVLLKTFPYLIHFSIDNEIIVIKAVLHTSRNSKINKITKIKIKIIIKISKETKIKKIKITIPKINRTVI